MAFINLSDRSLYLDECVLIALILGAYAVWLLVAWLRRSRPGLGIGRAVAVAFLLRLIAAAEQILALADDPECRERCRAIARAHLSLKDVGIPRYDRLYREVARG